MKTENKQYKLKRWYPSLHPEWKHEEITVEKTKDGNYVNFMDCQVVPKHEVEYNPDFWEEVKQPLFITEDGVEVFDQEDVYYVTDKLEKINSFINWFTIESMAKDTKIFKHESNADEYIAWYKKEFSINDLLLADVGITTSQLDKLQELAKERIEQ